MSYWYPRAAIQFKVLPEDLRLQSDASKQKSYIFTVEAEDVKITRNDYRTCDKFSATIDYKNFPFDPRMLRAVGVSIFIANVPPKDIHDTGETNEIVAGGPTSLDANVSNCVFIGFADEHEIAFDENGRKVIIEGRDTTSILIDQKYDGPGALNMNLPLDVAIRNFLATFPTTQKIQVMVSKGTDGNPLQMPIIASYRVGFGDKLGGGMNTGGGKKETYWDIIMDVCDQAGMICYMGISQLNGNATPTIFISTPKNQSTQIDLANGNFRTDTIDDIKFIYGQNIKNLTFKRKIGRLKGFNIQLICRNNKSVIPAKIPEQGNAAWLKAYGFKFGQPVTIPVLKPDGSVDETSIGKPAPYITFKVTGINTHAALVLKAQSVFEQYSLQQLEGSFDTFEMMGRGTENDIGKNELKASSDGLSYEMKVGIQKARPSVQYDLTQIRKGQTLCVEVDGQDIQSIARISSIGEKRNYLLSRGYTSELADLFASSINVMSPRFQVKSYTMELNKDNGFKLHVDFQNLIQIDNTGMSK